MRRPLAGRPGRGAGRARPGRGPGRSLPGRVDGDAMGVRLPRAVARSGLAGRAGRLAEHYGRGAPQQHRDRRGDRQILPQRRRLLDHRVAEFQTHQPRLRSPAFNRPVIGLRASSKIPPASGSWVLQDPGHLAPPGFRANPARVNRFAANPDAADGLSYTPGPAAVREVTSWSRRRASLSSSCSLARRRHHRGNAAAAAIAGAAATATPAAAAIPRRDQLRARRRLRHQGGRAGPGSRRGGFRGLRGQHAAEDRVLRAHRDQSGRAAGRAVEPSSVTGASSSSPIRSAASSSSTSTRSTSSVEGSHDIKEPLIELLTCWATTISSADDAQDEPVQLTFGRRTEVIEDGLRENWSWGRRDTHRLDKRSGCTTSASRCCPWRPMVGSRQGDDRPAPRAAVLDAFTIWSATWERARGTDRRHHGDRWMDAVPPDPSMTLSRGIDRAERGSDSGQAAAGRRRSGGG